MAADGLPSGLANVTLRVNSLDSAVELITSLIEDIVEVKIEDLSEVHIWVSRVILIDLIPEDILLLITFETEIVLAFSSPDVLVQDDARDSVFDIKVDKLLVGTNLEAVDLVIGTVASVPQMALVRDCSQLKSVRADERIYILATLDGGVIVVVIME